MSANDVANALSKVAKRAAKLRQTTTEDVEPLRSLNTAAMISASDMKLHEACTALLALGELGECNNDVYVILRVNRRGASQVR